MPNTPLQLRWLSGSVANLMHDNGIRNPADLANILPFSRSTLYRAFAQDWSGRATDELLAALASYFRVPISHLVEQPWLAVRRPR